LHKLRLVCFEDIRAILCAVRCWARQLNNAVFGNGKASLGASAKFLQNYEASYLG
jgi:hypothetical protein